MKSLLKTNILWLCVNVLRLVLACTFVFSGTVKLIDPHGTEYKIQDYGQALGLSAFLIAGVPLVLSVLLSACEFLLGVYLFFCIRRRLTVYSVLLFLLVMTPLTLYLALVNPVTDCGCFGDAVTLSNWQTFWKNVVLLASALFVWRHYRVMTRFISELNQWAISLYSVSFALVFALINLYGLPVIDFRPYHIGADVGAMASSAGSVEFDTRFILEKDGVRKEFTLDEYPDSTWTFVDSHTVQLGKDDSQGVENLQIQSVETGEDITSSILADDNYTFLLVAPYLEKADDGVMDRLLSLYDYCEDYGYSMYCLTSSGEDAIEHWVEITGAEYPFCYADAEILKSMVRSNPGLLLLKGGVVVNKWPSTALPKDADLTDKIEALPLSHPDVEGKAKRVVMIFLWYVLPLMLITIVDRLWAAWRKKR